MSLSESVWCLTGSLYSCRLCLFQSQYDFSQAHSTLADYVSLRVSMFSQSHSTLADHVSLRVSILSHYSTGWWRFKQSRGVFGVYGSLNSHGSVLPRLFPQAHFARINCSTHIRQDDSYSQGSHTPQRLPMIANNSTSWQVLKTRRLFGSTAAACRTRATVTD